MHQYVFVVWFVLMLAMKRPLSCYLYVTQRDEERVARDGLNCEELIRFFLQKAD